MNCKQGDLAIIVRASNPASVGKIVRCIAFYSGPGLLPDGRISQTNAGWRVEPRPKWVDGQEVIIIRDKNLRPIRDPGDDATDETLTWLPVPHKEHA